MSSSESAMPRTDLRAISTGCDVCGKKFHTVKAYNQHQRSFYLRETACYALPDETRVNVTAAERLKMSTAAVVR